MGNKGSKTEHNTQGTQHQENKTGSEQIGIQKCTLDTQSCSHTAGTQRQELNTSKGEKHRL